MGFNKKYLPAKYQLQQMVYDHGAEYVVRLYEKADALIGDSNSIEYYIKDPKFKNDLSK